MGRSFQNRLVLPHPKQAHLPSGVDPGLPCSQSPTIYKPSPVAIPHCLFPKCKFPTRSSKSPWSETSEFPDILTTLDSNSPNVAHYSSIFVTNIHFLAKVFKNIAISRSIRIALFVRKMMINPIIPNIPIRLPPFYIGKI